MLTSPLAAARAGTMITPERAPLRPIQIRWLGALLLAAQIPHLGDVPAWAAAFGLMLVGARLLLGIERAGGRLWSLRISPWILAVFALAVGLGIRASFGYFLGRDPCVAFLFVLIGIKFLETHDARDATLLICLAGFLVVTPFFYGQSMLAALASALRSCCWGRRCRCWHAPTSAPRWRKTGAVRWSARPASSRRASRWRPCCSSCSRGCPARCGDSRRSRRADRALDRMSPGDISALSLSDAVAFRVDFDGLAPPPPSATGAVRSFRASTAANGDRPPGRAAGELASGRGERVSYAVSMEPHGKPWLFALDMPSSLPHVEGSAAVARGGDMAFLTRDQQLIAFAPITQPTHYRVSSVLRGTHPLSSGSAAAAQWRENLHLPPATTAASRSRATCAHSTRTSWITSAPCSSSFAPDSSSTRSHRSYCPAIRSTRSCSTRSAASASTTPAPSSSCCVRPHPGARRDRLPGWRDQPRRWLHDRPPVGRARLGRGDRRW